MEFQQGQYTFRITTKSAFLSGYWTRIQKVSATALAHYLIKRADGNPVFAQSLKTFCPEEDNNVQGNPYPYQDDESEYLGLLTAKLMGLDVYYYDKSFKQDYIPGTRLENNNYTPPWEASGGGLFVTQKSDSQKNTVDENDPVQQHMANMRRISSHNITSQPHKLRAITNPATSSSPSTKSAPTAKPKAPPLSKNAQGGFIDPNAKDKIHDPARKPKITSTGKAIPYGGTDNDAITIRNKKNVNSDGYLVKGNKQLKYDEDGFPVFNSKYDTVLDDSHLGTQNEYAHFQAANESLARQINENPGLSGEMGLSDRQVKFLQKIPPEGIAPPGLTWHHHQDLGRMQLVDEAEHKTFRHTGGMSIWGGGYK